MEKLKQAVLQALSTVEDPDLKKDLVSLEMIQSLQVTFEKVTFTLVLTTPACPLQEYLKKACIEAIRSHVSKEILVDITTTARVTATQSQVGRLPNVKNIIAIASGKGGVGKSTIAANLAVSLAQQGATVGLLDADIFGPSIPTLFGCEHEKPIVEQVENKKYLVPLVKHGVKLISIGFLTPQEGAVVWRGPMASTALRQFLYDTAWEELDYLLVDLPPGTSDIQLTLVQAVPVTGAVIVTTPQKLALADVVKAIAMFKKSAIEVPILGLIENMAYFIPEELANKQRYYPFGQGGGKELADNYDVPFLGEIPLITAIRETSDEGVPAAKASTELGNLFKDLASALAQQVSIRNIQLFPTQRVLRK
ncbi:MAG: MRP family ATP-binding protein [Candidatus Amoebophilus sp. 36-38]|mgnify:CR=1 FL=1|nr:MAG: MRP family ATP-binding protein [Candidatus Amoebophilus sp. 36-38]